MPSEIILQTFDWNMPFNTRLVDKPDSFYKELLAQVSDIAKAGYTAVWLPPVWRDTSKNKVGYFWNDFDKNSAYGTDSELKALVRALTDQGIKIIYDLVVNHKNINHKKREGVWLDIPLGSQRANIKKKQEEGLDIFKSNDLNLENHSVFQAFVGEIINLILNYGACGFRFDFAKGIHARIVNDLIEAAKTSLRITGHAIPDLFLVGEYWDLDQKKIKHWSDACHANMFDFPLQKALVESRKLCNTEIRRGLNANFRASWRKLAVTFVDNHDTGLSDDSLDRKDPSHRHYDDTYYKRVGKGKHVPRLARKAAYTYIFLSAGHPSVYWPHWHTWGEHDGLKNFIRDLISIRKSANISAESVIEIHDEIKMEGVFITVREPSKPSENYFSFGINLPCDHPVVRAKLSGEICFSARDGSCFIACPESNTDLLKTMRALDSFVVSTSFVAPAESVLEDDSCPLLLGTDSHISLESASITQENEVKGDDWRVLYTAGVATSPEGAEAAVQALIEQVEAGNSIIINHIRQSIENNLDSEKIPDPTQEFRLFFDELTPLKKCLFELKRAFTRRMNSKEVQLAYLKYLHAIKYADPQIVDACLELGIEQVDAAVETKVGVGTFSSTKEATFSEAVSPLLGLSYQPVPGDGHCLYHAVGLYLGKDQNELREFVARHIEGNPEDFLELLAALKLGTVGNYVKSLRAGIEWADNIELVILMKIFKRPIVVIGPDGKIRNSVDLVGQEGEPIFVFYNGHNHYDAYTVLSEYKDRTGEILDHLFQRRISSRMPVLGLGFFNSTPTASGVAGATSGVVREEAVAIGNRSAAIHSEIIDSVDMAEEGGHALLNKK